MERPQLSVADVIRANGQEFLAARGSSVTSAQRRVLERLAACRTAALGGHKYECDACGEPQISYNSCRNRHCPTCLAHRSVRWLADRQKELLPVPYFHIVFTVPEEVAALALANKRAVYDLIFRCAGETLLNIAENPKRLGAKIGFLAVLHTWSQALLHHPHVHCVVPGGGLSTDKSRWIRARPKFFLPVRVLRRYYRTRFIKGLRSLKNKGKLNFARETAELADDEKFEAWLQKLSRKEWVVYAKPPFGSPAQVLKYLARYTHRVAISNGRLVELKDGKVRLRYRDAKRGDQTRIMSLDAGEFLRRFLLHVHPKRFVRIRFFGFLAHSSKREDLSRCRELLGATAASEESTATPDPANDRDDHTRPCPTCGRGRLIMIAEIAPGPIEWSIPRAANDTS